MIKQATVCKFTVGQNGLIWLSGEPAMEHLAVRTIEKINEESHISGLTDRIKVFLEKETGKKIEAEPNFNNDASEAPENKNGGEE